MLTLTHCNCSGINFRGVKELRKLNGGGVKEFYLSLSLSLFLFPPVCGKTPAPPFGITLIL